ncbi:MAG: amino acid kinase [Candidatus Thorarchaeota archaeon]|nr:MAG: amino acid kinase [Candidatus Thorarchaeota archaeon]
MRELIILKLGGSVITRGEEKAEVDEENLRRLAREIAEAKRDGNFRLMVVHGAGPFGHVPARKYGLDKGLRDDRQLEGFSVTHQSMEKLNFSVVCSLREEGINAIAYQPSTLGILRDKELVYFPTRVLERLLEMDMIPVAYGDVLVDEKTGINILSGDHLVPYLARRLKADRVVIATDVDGVFNLDPKKHENAELIKEITSENVNSILEVGTSRRTDVTGGMERKLNELLCLAAQGIHSEIVSGVKPDILKRALLGEKGLGTLIREDSGDVRNRNRIC